MKVIELEKSIFEVEKFYKKRMIELVKSQKLDEAHSLFLEFVVDGKEPTTFTCIRKL